MIFSGFVLFIILVILIFLSILIIIFINLLLFLILSKVWIVWLVIGFNWSIMELEEIFLMLIILCKMVFFRILVLEEWLFCNICFIWGLVWFFIDNCMCIFLFFILFERNRKYFNNWISIFSNLWNINSFIDFYLK